MRRWAIAVGLAGILATAGLWLFSHVAPQDFGTCHVVALYLQSNPTVRDCDPYEATDFAVPLAAIALLVPFVLVAAGDGDTQAEIPLPAWLGGKLLLTRRVEAATTELAESAPSLDERGLEYLETLRGDHEEAP
jgi:hypothetical protein